jgi:RNA polymerase sigma factor for flagellar operon FliA
MLQRTQGVRLNSLDETRSYGGSSLLDNIKLEQSSPFDEVKKKELKSVISDVLSILPEKEQQVLSLYYFEELTLKEIGSVMGLTESRISQIHSKVIINLRSKLKTYHES